MAKTIVRIIPGGGLGDILLFTPVLKALKEKDRRTRTIVYANRKNKEIFVNNPYVDRLTMLSFWHDPLALLRWLLRRKQFINPRYDHLSPSLSYKKPASEIIAEFFDVRLEDKQVQVFLTRQEEEEARKRMAQFRNPIILQSSTRSSQNKLWPMDHWERLVAGMPDHTFIQMGAPDDERVRGTVDLLGKTSFREALGLVKYCRSFVGVDSSLAHATNAFGIPGVVLFGASMREIFGHPNNINISLNLRCSPCMDILFKESCPYANRCMTQLSVEQVTAALLRQLNSHNEYEKQRRNIAETEPVTR